jgi:hypothetical protein
MRALTAVGLAVVLSTAGACSSTKSMPTENAAPAAIVAGRVTASRVAGGIAIANGTERGIGYAVTNLGWLGLIATCSDPSPSCVRLAPGSVITVPLNEVYGGSEQMTDAVVYWWQVLPRASGGYEASDAQRIPVSVRY